MALDTHWLSKVLDEGEESTFSTGSSKDGWASTICALRHKSGEASAYYVDVYPVKKTQGSKEIHTGKFRVSLKKVMDCEEKQVYSALLKMSELHSSNIPDNEDGPNYLEFGRYTLIMSADHSWALGITKR
jgi:hypothetical protein